MKEVNWKRLSRVTTKCWLIFQALLVLKRFLIQKHESNETPEIPRIVKMSLHHFLCAI
ncbi:hypothetical protein PHOSAC3_90643 [Mesotoga infera]|nr:hypothetical protein PHOSAC3_90643 [Mesotoga infera]